MEAFHQPQFRGDHAAHWLLQESCVQVVCLRLGASIAHSGQGVKSLCKHCRGLPERESAIWASSSLENSTWQKPRGAPCMSRAMVTFVTRPHLLAHQRTGGFV